MNLFRSAIFVMCAVLMFSIGPSSSATTNYSHPAFSVADDRVLNLREAGSKIVVETIEDALRAGGIALFDERFQIDSSLDWVLGEAVSGELEAVVPLWSRDGHVVFTQPGFVLWNGLADDNRLDGNLGVVYRTNLLNTPVGFDAIGGVSLFYDHDFQIGHSRIGIGVDVQRDGLHGAFNYYHPLSDTQDGREGYVEDALQGMDASLAVESDVTRVGGNVGYWLFQGDEDDKDEWEFSYGLDAGLRLMPGVFLEGRLESHDKASLGRRASVGLAFRFNLPNFDGKSYGEGVRVSNLWSPVDRESRILYEEREAVPKANLVASGTGNTRNIAVQLEETFAEDVVLNLIGAGSATYNDDWTISVGGDDCPVVDGTDCSVTVMAGETSPSDEVVITFQDPARGEPAEDIILSVEIASTGVELAPGNPVVVQIPEGPPLPTVSFNYNGSRTVQENAAVNHVTMTLELSETLTEAVTLNLVAGGTATYGRNTINDDWQIRRRIVSIGDTPSDDEILFTGCNSAVSGGNGCEVTFQPGETVADIHLQIHEDGKTESPEDFTISVEVASGSTHLVQTGSPSVLNFTIQDAPLPTVSLSTSSTDVEEGDMRTITVTLSESLTRDATFNLVPSGDATRGSGGDWLIFNVTCVSDSNRTVCPVNISQGNTTATVDIAILTDTATEMMETATVTVEIDSGSTDIVALGSSSRLDFTIQDVPPPTASLNYSGSGMIAASARMRIDLSEPLSETVTVTLVAGGTATFSKNGGVGTWSLQYLVLPENSNPAASFPGAPGGAVDCLDDDIKGTGCQIDIPAKQTIVDINVITESLTSRDTIMLTLGIGSAGMTGLTTGTSSTVMLTAQ